MTLLLAGLALLTGLLVLLLVAPVGLTAVAASDPARVRVALRLFWWLRVPAFDSARPRRVRKAPTKPRALAARKSGGRFDPRLARVLPRAILDAIGKVRIDRLRGTLTVGLADPALTGELYGRLAGPMAAIPRLRGLRLVPVFDRETLQAEGELALSLIPARLLPVAWRAARDWRRAGR